MASIELLEALFRAAGELPSAAKLAALHEATCEYVSRGKREGLSPDQIASDVRAAATRAQTVLPSAVVEDLIDDCLGRYFTEGRPGE